eukprot:COSAG05_NODE_1392_length_4998_cov_9.918147_3_plen_816_part_00
MADTVDALLARVREQHAQLGDPSRRLTRQQILEIDSEVLDLSAQVDALAKVKQQATGNDAALSPAMSKLHSTKSSVEDSTDEHIINLREAVDRRQRQLMQRARGPTSAAPAMGTPAPESEPAVPTYDPLPTVGSQRMFPPPRLDSRPLHESVGEEHQRRGPIVSYPPSQVGHLLGHIVGPVDNLSAAFNGQSPEGGAGRVPTVDMQAVQTAVGAVSRAVREATGVPAGLGYRVPTESPRQQPDAGTTAHDLSYDSDKQWQQQEQSELARRHTEPNSSSRGLDVEKAAAAAAENASAREALAVAAKAVEAATQAVVDASATAAALPGHGAPASTRPDDTAAAQSDEDSSRGSGGGQRGDDDEGWEGETEAAEPQYVTAVQMAAAQRRKAERAAEEAAHAQRRADAARAVAAAATQARRHAAAARETAQAYTQMEIDHTPAKDRDPGRQSWVSSHAGTDMEQEQEQEQQQQQQQRTNKGGTGQQRVERADTAVVSGGSEEPAHQAAAVAVAVASASSQPPAAAAKPVNSFRSSTTAAPPTSVTATNEEGESHALLQSLHRKLDEQAQTIASLERKFGQHQGGSTAASRVGQGGRQVPAGTTRTHTHDDAKHFFDHDAMDLQQYAGASMGGGGGGSGGTPPTAREQWLRQAIRLSQYLDHVDDTHGNLSITMMASMAPSWPHGPVPSRRPGGGGAPPPPRTGLSMVGRGAEFWRGLVEERTLPSNHHHHPKRPPSTTFPSGLAPPPPPPVVVFDTRTREQAALQEQEDSQREVAAYLRVRGQAKPLLVSSLGKKAPSSSSTRHTAWGGLKVTVSYLDG